MKFYSDCRSLFSGRVQSDRERLQALLYLGSDRWHQMHMEFKIRGHPFIKTSEVRENERMPTI